MIRVDAANDKVYAFTRPYPDMNGIVLVNFDAAPQSVSVVLQTLGQEANVIFRAGVRQGSPYYASDLYGDTVYTVSFAGTSATLTATVPPYGSRVLVLSDSVYRLAVPPITSVEVGTEVEVPRQAALSQNYPNPFNPTTRIQYSVPSTQYVTLKVYDVLGREVATLVDELKKAGTYTATWDARGVFSKGGGASGVYFYRIKIGHFVETKKAVLIR